MKVKVLVTQSCLTLCDLMDSIPPGSSVHGILQAIKLERVAISFSNAGTMNKVGNVIQIGKLLLLLLSHFSRV